MQNHPITVEHSETNGPRSLWWDCHLQSPNPRLSEVKSFCVETVTAEPLEQTFCCSAFDCRLCVPRMMGAAPDRVDCAHLCGKCVQGEERPTKFALDNTKCEMLLEL